MKKRVLTLLMLVASSVQANEPLALSQLLQAVLSNPAIVAKEELTKAAQSQVDTAKWQYFPTPTFSVQQAQVSAKDISYQGDATVSILGLQQPLWTGGKLSAGVEKAEYEQKSSVSALEEAKRETQLSAVQSYGDWLIASMKIKVADRSIVTHQKLYDRIERRVNEGLSAESDLTLALSRLQQVQADRYNAIIQQQASLARLSQLVGRTLTSEDLAVDQPKAIPETAGRAVDLALSTHPTLQKLTLTSQAALSEVEVQKSALYPDIVARVEQQYGNFQIRNTDSDARFFIGVQSKLGAGLSVLSAVDSAKLKYQASLSDIENAKRTLTQQVLTEWTNAKQLDTRLLVLKQALLSGEKIVDGYDRQFISGKKSWLDVMNAARELAQTENQLAEATGGLTMSSWKLSLLTSRYDVKVSKE